VIDAYLARLGLRREPPSAEALQRLHRAHVERVPYETVWIHIGQQYGCTAEESLARIATTTRGGYCFHLNGAFSELLAALGYDVVRHIGGVHGPEGPDAAAMTNHLVLTVHGLASHDNPAGDWYVDVGLGDALYDALPLRAGEYEQPPFHVTLAATPGDVGDWHLAHDPAGSFPGMSWCSAQTDLSAFAPRHVELSTSPESGFVKTLTIQRRGPRHVDILRGLVLLRVGKGGGGDQREIASRDELASVLHDVFGFHRDEFSAAELDTLWERTLARHLAWKEQSASAGAG